MRDVGAGLVEGPATVVDPYITYGVDIWVAIQPGDFTGVVGVGGGVAWTTVGIHDDQELERGISLDSVWFNAVFIFPFPLLRLDLFSDLRCIERGPGLLRQWINVQRDHDRRFGGHVASTGQPVKRPIRDKDLTMGWFSCESGAMDGLFYSRD